MKTVTVEKLPRPEKVITSLLSPVERFIRTERASGIALIGAALVAFVWANSPGSDSYVAMKEITVGVRFGGFELEKPLVDWVNDFLMAIFFFLVGLEIKRELLVGELASLQKAALPAAGAFGGMLVPALIYAGLNWDGAVRGWGVPMATDIAFAVGVLALLGPRVLLPAKVFLLALAIVDDLGAVAVIALFYTQDLNVAALFISLSVWALAILYGRARGSNAMVYPCSAWSSGTSCCNRTCMRRSLAFSWRCRCRSGTAWGPKMRISRRGARFRRAVSSGWKSGWSTCRTCWNRVRARCTAWNVRSLPTSPI